MATSIEFIWFIGVVEDRLDPLKLGRCRVRVLGKHTEQKKLIPTDELPWAWPMSPITTASMNGIGQTPLGPVEGTWVTGFFRDGADLQEPIIMGTLPGIPSDYAYTKNEKIGFLDTRKDLSKKPRKIKKKIYLNDGNGAQLTEEVPSPPEGQLFPKTNNPFGITVGEVDTNRLARNENISDTIVNIKATTKDTGIPAADGTTWDEPTTPYDSSYPYNHVFESESGHVIEVDDTRGVERLHTYHRSGTFAEIYPDGVKVEKVVGNNYRIVLEEQYDHIQNRYCLTIDGPWNVIVQNKAHIIVKGDAVVEVGGNMETSVRGNYSLKVGGSMTLESKGAATLKSSAGTLVGAGSTVELRGSSVNSYPAINQAKESLKSLISNSANALSGPAVVITPVPPSPQSASTGNPDNAIPIRIWPRAVGPYVAVKEK